jgi:hypothetical protein
MLLFVKPKRARNGSSHQLVSPIQLESSAQLVGPGLEACAKHRTEAFAEFGSLRASVSSLKLGLYASPKRKGLVVTLSAKIGDLNVAGPAV